MNPDLVSGNRFFRNFMAEELEHSTSKGSPESSDHESVMEATQQGSVSLDQSMHPSQEVDLSNYTMRGINGATVEERKQVGVARMLAFAQGKEIANAPEVGALTQQEFALSEIVSAHEEFLQNYNFSPALQSTLADNPDFLFMDPAAGQLSAIEHRTGNSIGREHPDLQEIRDKAQSYIPSELPGGFSKDRLPSLGLVNGEDMRVIKEAAKQHNNNIPYELRDGWEGLKEATKAAA